MENVKQHFEAEAEEFDSIIRRLIPYYEQILDALLMGLPFDPAGPIRVIDPGCGTGTIARRIKDAYPQAKITCVDIAEKMLQIASAKLGGFTARFIVLWFQAAFFTMRMSFWVPTPIFSDATWKNGGSICGCTFLRMKLNTNGYLSITTRIIQPV